MRFRIKSKRKRKKITIKKIIIFFIVAIILISVGYAAYTQDLTIAGQSAIKDEADLSNIIVDVKLKASWGYDGDYTYIYTISITNNSSKNIDGWSISFTVPEETKVIQESNATVNIIGTKLICSNSNIVQGNGGIANAEIAINTSEADFKYTDLEFYPNSTGGGTTDPVEPTGLTLNITETSIYVGETKDLIATITPSGATGVIIWKSSDVNVVTVSNTGKVTAIGTGTATITAILNEFKATCNINVSENHSIAENVTITVKKAGGWGNTIQYSVDIKNISTEMIDYWEFQAELPENVTIGGYWNCTITKGENNIYTFSSGTNSAYLSPGNTNSFGVQIDCPTSEYAITPINIVTR